MLVVSSAFPPVALFTAAALGGLAVGGLVGGLFGLGTGAGIGKLRGKKK